MTTLLEIKPYIRDFIQENLDESFDNKIYWIGERKIEPDYPYCLLNAISENKDKRTSTHDGNLLLVNYSGSNEYEEFREVITTLYKTATITIGVYNAWIEETYDDVDMDEAKEFAYQQINLLEDLFETRTHQEEFYPVFGVQTISPIRPLHETTSGGYIYRYEFDLTIGYNEPYIENKDVGKQVEVEMHQDSINGDINIWFEVDSETGQINNLI